MTYLLFHENSYIKEFEATVIDVDEVNHGIILDRTAFFPGGGGQPADRGLISWGENIIRVERVRKFGENITHLIGIDVALPAIGVHVNGVIDWNLRYQIMRTHTAMHVLCGVIFRDYGASVTGGDMDPLQGRMDFEFDTMHKELVEEIEIAINQEIKKALPVRTAILPREEAFKIPDLIRTKINLLPQGIEQVRIVEIIGLDLQADGGTHVNNTSEIGRMRVVNYKSKGAINKRIYVEISDQ